MLKVHICGLLLQIALSVCVGHSLSCAKVAEPVEMPFVCGLGGPK